MSEPKFPLYHRPSSLVFLDDEPSYLEMLAMVMPREQNILFFTRVNDYKDYVGAKALEWQLDLNCHQEILRKWYEGQALPQQIFDYWTQQGQRYTLPLTAVVDYAMPAATGLQVLKESPAWPTYRVLLTGKADEQVAIAAFNDGWIDRFLTKQHPDLARQLLRHVHQLSSSPILSHESLWLNAMRSDRRLALQQRATQHALNEWLATHRCIEYVILPEPFGLLALDRNAHAHWLQFELAHDLHNAADVAEVAGASEDQRHAIASGRALSSAEWQMATRSGIPPALSPAWSLGPQSHLLAAHFPLPELGQLGQSFNDYVASLPERGANSID